MCVGGHEAANICGSQVGVLSAQPVLASLNCIAGVLCWFGPSRSTHPDTQSEENGMLALPPTPYRGCLSLIGACRMETRIASETITRQTRAVLEGGHNRRTNLAA